MLMTESEYPLNMRNWGHTRKRHKPGDLFTYLMPDGKYRFLRLVSDRSQSGMGVPVNLLYFYDFAVDSRQPPPRDAFAPPHLLIPPQLTNNLGWVRGWFKFVAHWPLQTGEVFPRHCFQSEVFPDRYFDEHGNRIERPFEPLGSWAVTSYAMIDLHLSRALGIPHAYDLAKQRSERRGS